VVLNLIESTHAIGFQAKVYSPDHLARLPSIGYLGLDRSIVQISPCESSQIILTTR